MIHYYFDFDWFCLNFRFLCFSFNDFIVIIFIIERTGKSPPVSWKYAPHNCQNVIFYQIVSITEDIFRVFSHLLWCVFNYRKPESEVDYRAKKSKNCSILSSQSEGHIDGLSFSPICAYIIGNYFIFFPENPLCFYTLNAQKVEFPSNSTIFFIKLHL